MKKGIQNSYSTFPSSVNMRYGNYMSNGGAMNQLTEFNEGGRHEENGLGGIPQGMNPDGQMNLVEEGETKFDAENYIFSDTLKVDKELAKAFNLSPKMIGKTFADASKMAGRKKSRREGDKIEEAANEADLMNLMEAQEAFKQKEIEERLTEISQLDPTVLPALMGQGQDPNMMQEAPMDEQAMMEQQMMAQQGQPSPEEIAMMQQQQDMAMGQQEGMMRGGGALDYPNYGGLGRIKKAEGPMTEDEAQMIEAYKRHQETLNTIDRITEKPNYLVTGEPLAGDLLPLDTYREWWNTPRLRLNYVSKTGRDAPPEAEKLGGYLGDGKSSFGGGGYMSRSYAPGGFMGMNMANAGMMNTGAMGTSADLEGCMCADGSTHTSCCQQGYEGGSQAGIATKDYQGMFRGRKLPFRHRRTLKKADVNLAQGEKVFEKGLTGSGGLRATSPANWANLDLSGYTQEQQDQILNSELLRKDPAAFSELNPDLLSKEDLKQVGKVKAALEWTPPAQEAGFSFTPSVPDDGSTRGGDGSGTLRGPGTGSTPVIRTDHNFTKLGKFAHNIQPWNWTRDKLVRSNPTKFAKWSGYRSGLNKFGGNLMQSGQEAGLNSMQGMNQLMRGGGKLCYGCGGAMHNYGGRMNQMATGGEIISGIGSGLYGVGEGLLDTLTFGLTDELTDKGYEALQEIGPMKGEDNIGDAIRGGANIAGAATGAVLTGGATTGSAVSQGSKGTGDMLGAIGEETGNETLGKIGQGIEGAGQVAGMFIGGGGAGSAAGKAAEGAGTVAAGAGTLSAGAKVADAAKTAEAASKAAKAAKFAKVGEIASNKGVQAGVNMASTAIGSAEEKAEQERLAEEERKKIERDMQMTNDPNSIYYNPAVARYGKKLYKNGGKQMIKRADSSYSQSRLYYPGGYLFGPAGEMPSTPIPDPTEKQDGTYGSDMPSSFIDMSTGTNPLGLVSPMYNLGMGLFGKESDLSYPIEKFTFKPFDFTESKNALRRQAAKAMDSLRKTGNTNPANILALKNLNAQTEAAYLERAENINAQREQAAADNNTKLMNKYNKELRELRLKNEAIKDEFIKTGLQDLVGFAEQERENEYMFNFLKTMAPNVVTGSYNSIFDIFNKKDKKDKKD